MKYSLRNSEIGYNPKKVEPPSPAPPIHIPHPYPTSPKTHKKQVSLITFLPIYNLQSYHLDLSNFTCYGICIYVWYSSALLCDKLYFPILNPEYIQMLKLISLSLCVQ